MRRQSLGGSEKFGKSESGGCRVSVEDVELMGREVVYDGYFRLDRYRLRHRQFAGGIGPVLTREILERGQVAAVLPVDPARDRVVLIEQFRPGAWAAGRDPWLLECVAGVIEPGETPEELARREALEEAGCVIADLLPIATFLTSPGATTETVRLFCGRVDSEGVGGCTDWPGKGRTSGRRSCRWKTPWRCSTGAASSTPRRSSRCNGLRVTTTP